MKVSVIIPVFNVEQYLTSCLESVVSQTYSNLEIILVDDGSTDSSSKICDKWQEKDNRIRVVHKSNGGLSSARNAGLNIATGDYVYFLDSDDEITNTAIELLSRPLCDKYYDIVIGELRISPEGASQLKQTAPEGGIVSRDLIQRYYCNYQLYNTAWNKLISVSFLRRNKILFCPGIIHEDELWSFMTYCLAESIYVCKEPCYIYKIREGSIITSRDIGKTVYSYITIKEQLNFFIEEHNLQSNLMVFSKYQNLCNEMLGNLDNICSPELKSFYRKLRRLDFYKKTEILCVLVHTPRFLLRDSHLLFSSNVGYYIFILLQKIRKIKTNLSRTYV